MTFNTITPHLIHVSIQLAHHEMRWEPQWLLGLDHLCAVQGTHGTFAFFQTTEVHQLSVQIWVGQAGLVTAQSACTVTAQSILRHFIGAESSYHVQISVRWILAFSRIDLSFSVRNLINASVWPTRTNLSATCNQTQAYGTRLICALHLFKWTRRLSVNLRCSHIIALLKAVVCFNH